MSSAPPQVGNSDALVTVFGGSGFVGRHVVRALARRGYRVRVAVRRPDLAGFLRTCGAVGQIHSLQANVRDMGSVARAVEGADAVINLVGILAESRRQKFDAVHAAGAENIATAAAAADVGRLVHMSAIGADEDSDSHYARSKAAGEEAVHDAMRSAVILRPSIQFGQEDAFFNRFAAMARLSPVLPLVGAETRFQPVFVGDVAEAVAAALKGAAKPGKIYELGGPEVATFAELMQRMLEVVDRRRLIVPVPFPVARFMAAFLQLVPGKPLTIDQVRLLAVDNVVSDKARSDGRTLEGLGVAARGMGPILPTYLYRFRKWGQFHEEMQS